MIGVERVSQAEQQCDRERDEWLRRGERGDLFIESEHGRNGILRLSIGSPRGGNKSGNFAPSTRRQTTGTPDSENPPERLRIPQEPARARAA